MKLTEYARQQGVRYRTAWRWWKAGKVPGHQMDTGTLERPAARGHQVAKVVTEVGSGGNDGRPKLVALRADHGIRLLGGEHTDRLPRCGFRSLETVLKTQGRAVAVVHQAENGTEDLLADLSAIVSSFCARRAGQRRARRTTAVLVRALETTGESDALG
jgi:putative resolvase